MQIDIGKKDVNFQIDRIIKFSKSFNLLEENDAGKVTLRINSTLNQQKTPLLILVISIGILNLEI